MSATLRQIDSVLPARGRLASRGERRRAARGLARLLARPLWGWVGLAGYRPELHYMRGGRTFGAKSAGCA